MYDMIVVYNEISDSITIWNKKFYSNWCMYADRKDVRHSFIIGFF